MLNQMKDNECIWIENAKVLKRSVCDDEIVRKNYINLLEYKKKLK